MKTALRVTNVLLILLFAFTAVGLFMQTGVAEGVGALAWVIPAILAFRCLGHPQARFAKAALIANVLAVVAAGIVIAIGVQAPQVVVGMVMVTTPFVLNVWGVRQWRNQVREDEEYEPATASRPVPKHNFPPALPNTPSAVAQGTAPIEPAEEQSPANYFVRHWRGELPLPISYWINGSLVSIALVAVISGVSAAVEDQVSLRTSSAIGVISILLVIVSAVWSPVGIWRSARKHPARGGSPGWATVAKVMVVLGAIGSVTSITRSLLPQLREYSMIAAGYDHLGRIEATVSKNGAAVLLKGMFGAGSADDVKRLLEQVPGATTLVLDSSGGRLHEAQIIAEVARQRQMNTYVETHCESACTYIFLAGVDRAATPNARIGFHQPSFPGMEGRELMAATNDMLAVYRTAGVKEEFLARVKATQSSDMWYPQRDELINAGVINRVSLGGEGAGAAYRSPSELELAFRSVPFLLALDERFPGTVDQAVAAAWAQHQQGGREADVMTAARKIVTGHYDTLLKLADDQLLNDFLKLGIDQMEAARAVSDEACALLVRTELDITNVLPKEIVEREQAWIIKALRAPARVEEQYTETQLNAILEPLFERVSEDSLAVLAEPEKYAAHSTALCDANIELMQALNSMPSPATAFRVLQASEE